MSQPSLHRLRARDMVWIPGGTFRMGSDRHYPEEAPAHPVCVDGFWIDRHPVTNRQFADFVRETSHVTIAERPRTRPTTPAPIQACWCRRPSSS